MEKFKLTKKDPQLIELINKTDHKILALWGIECAERVLPFFEENFPDDKRPRKALETLKEWIATGKFSMKTIRKASLDSHAAARETGEDNAARSAARACGQTVAIAHVKTHAYGPAIYAQQAVFRNSKPEEAEKNVQKEREWQYKRLMELKES